MKSYKKSFLGSAIAFVVGTSCCWLSTLAIWVGGAAFLGAAIRFIEDIQVFLISIGILGFLIGLILYLKTKKLNKRP